MKLSFLTDVFKKPQPIQLGRPLHCIFYSHIWTVYALEKLGLLNPKTDIIVELATESNFAPALNPHNNYHENLLSLLQPNKHLHQLGAHFVGIPARMVTSPPASSSLNALLSALALVETDASPLTKALVLVHINDAEKFTQAYAMMGKFSVVWDVADYPNTSLPALAQVLADSDCLDEQHWGGIHLCNHQQRQLPDSTEREASLRQLLNEFPALKTA